MPAVGITSAGRAESSTTGRKLAEGLRIANGKPQGAFPPSRGSLSPLPHAMPTPALITPAQAVDENSSGYSCKSWPTYV